LLYICEFRAAAATTAATTQSAVADANNWQTKALKDKQSKANRQRN
jgi:hypothetical protein